MLLGAPVNPLGQAGQVGLGDPLLAGRAAELLSAQRTGHSGPSGPGARSSWFVPLHDSPLCLVAPEAALVPCPLGQME